MKVPVDLPSLCPLAALVDRLGWRRSPDLVRGSGGCGVEGLLDLEAL